MSSKRCIVLLLFPLMLESVFVASNAQDNVVTLSHGGQAEGLTLKSRKGRNYQAFYGIYYGKFKQRFAVSELAPGWSGKQAFVTHPEDCVQFDALHQKIEGIEDCLTLTVYSPNTKKGANLPVLFWTFPGGFQIGGAKHYEAKYFMDEDVVLVTVNYRLGAFGFLNTGDSVLPGNNGLKDQVLALKWIQKEISNFGGNPNRVTVFGLSAGGASTEYLMMSPMAKGLLHGGISMSGSVLGPWAFQQYPRVRSRVLAKYAGCNSEASSGDIVNCLRGKDAKTIVNAVQKFAKLGKEMDFISMKFTPSVEAESAPGPKFLTDTPYNLLQAGKIANRVPWISGYVDNEGSLYIAAMIHKKAIVERLNKEWNQMAPLLFYYDDIVPKSDYAAVSKKIWNFYFGDNGLSEATARNFSDIYSDRFFLNSVAESILMHAKYQNVYPYYFNYPGTHSLITPIFHVEGRDGNGHADDMTYLFNGAGGSPEFPVGTPDGDFSAQFVKFFVDFARTGKPSNWGTQWKPISGSAKSIQYYRIFGKNSVELIDDPAKDHRAFWDSLKLKEHQYSWRNQ